MSCLSRSLCCVQGWGGPGTTHPNLCSYFLVRAVFTWGCCEPGEEVHRLWKCSSPKQRLASGCAAVPPAPLLSVPWPGVVQEALLNRSCCGCTGLFPERCKTLLLSLSFPRFLSACSSKSPWVAVLPSSTLTHPPDLVSSVNVTRVRWVASSESVVKTWKRTGPRTAPVVLRLWPGRVTLLAELDCPEMIGKTRGEAQLGTCSRDLAPQMGRSDEHRRAGSTSERGKRSCDSLQLR